MITAQANAPPCILYHIVQFHYSVNSTGAHYRMNNNNSSHLVNLCLKVSEFNGIQAHGDGSTDLTI